MAVSPIQPNVRIVDRDGLLTREGFQLLQSIQATVSGGTFQPASNILTGLSGMGATPLGFVVQTAATSFLKRTLQQPADGFTITNPAGTAGDPTFVLADDLLGLETLTGTGVARRNGVSSWELLPTAFASWTPTLTNGANVAASTAFLSNYLEFGTHVIGWGIVDIDPTAAADTSTVLGISLPVASNFAASQDCVGFVVASGAQRAGMILADIVNDRATVTFASEVTANTQFAFGFFYKKL